ncbi:MAG: hypothetical protein ACREA0_34385, partial [bacterium]
MTKPMTEEHLVPELRTRHQTLYDGPGIEAKLTAIIRDAPQSKLSAWDIHRILRTSRSVYFDTHIEVVSGHHTGTLLRFESVVRFPQLVRLIARDMADWIRLTFQKEPIVGVVATSSDAQLLAEDIADLLRDVMR